MMSFSLLMLTFTNSMTQKLMPYVTVQAQNDTPLPPASRYYIPLTQDKCLTGNADMKHADERNEKLSAACRGNVTLHSQICVTMSYNEYQSDCVENV